jgi:nitrate reductase gamma subunit
MTHYLFQVAFVWYPYVCFTVFLLGSLIRFERDPYTWRASSSQILRKRQLFWGSNLFHVGILFLLFGLTMLLHRRLFDARIRRTSSVMDIAILAILWLQLTLGLVTLPLSIHHSDGGVMLALSHWAQGIVILNPVDVTTLEALPWPYLAHLVLGMTVFLVFPFSRLVHIWSAPVWYLGRRGYQVVRTRRPLPARQPPVRQPAE